MFEDCAKIAEMLLDGLLYLGRKNYPRSTNKTSLTVGLAVAIPVFCVLVGVALVFFLYKLRNKRHLAEKDSEMNYVGNGVTSREMRQTGDNSLPFYPPKERRFPYENPFNKAGKDIRRPESPTGLNSNDTTLTMDEVTSNPKYAMRTAEKENDMSFGTYGSDTMSSGELTRDHHDSSDEKKDILNGDFNPFRDGFLDQQGKNAQRPAEEEIYEENFHSNDRLTPISEARDIYHNEQNSFSQDQEDKSFDIGRASSYEIQNEGAGNLGHSEWDNSLEENPQPEVKHRVNNYLSTEADIQKGGSDATENKHPRLSDFNLIDNYSEDEEEEPEKGLSAEQEEELRRLKSVYKEYFNRNHSIIGPEGRGLETLDTSYLLPEAGVFKINKELVGDTNYDKRFSNTSSMYSKTPGLSREEIQYYQAQQIYAAKPNIHQQHILFQDEIPPVKKELPPLRVIPTPSNFRQSTLQTYTDFQGNHRKPISSNKLPFVPINNDEVWSSPSSPINQASPSINGSLYSLATINSQGEKPTPSPSQLKRSSLVMVNPVTEINIKKTRKPAGAVPKVVPSNSFNLEVPKER